MVVASATFFDASAGGRLLLRGEDRCRFLHNFCTNDIETLAEGDTCEAFVTDMRGHVLGHVWVCAQPERLWVHTVGSSVDDLRVHLEKYIITEDVVIEDVTSTTSRVVVCGDQAREAAGLISETSATAVSRAAVCWVSDGDVLLWLETEPDSELPLVAVLVHVVDVVPVPDPGGAGEGAEVTGAPHRGGADRAGPASGDRPARRTAAVPRGRRREGEHGGGRVADQGERDRVGGGGTGGVRAGVRRDELVLAGAEPVGQGERRDAVGQRRRPDRRPAVGEVDLVATGPDHRIPAEALTYVQLGPVQNHLHRRVDGHR